MSLAQAYGAQKEHDRLFPIILEPIHKALAATISNPASWSCWR